MHRNLISKLKIAYSHTGKIAFAIVLVCAFAISGFLASSTTTAQATIPKYINFQGKLTKASDGSNVANGTYAFEFKIYDASTSGSLLWTETFDQPSGSCGKLTVTNGVFNAKLGSCSSLAGVDFTGGSLYLTVNFAPTGTSYDGEMSPRKQLVSSAFAFVANSVSGDGVVNNAIQSSTALTTGRTSANPALQVDTNTGSSVTGLKITAAASGGGLALATISSGSNESLTLDAKGSGTISLGATSTGDVLLAGGSGATGCTVTNSNGNFTCTGAGSFSNFSGTTSGTNTGDVTLGAFGSSPNANGASLSGQVLTLQPADGSNPGGVSTTTQTFAGAKTFSSTVTSTGLLTASNGLTLTTGALNLTGTSGSIALTGFGTTSVTSTTATGNINTWADSSLAPASSATAYLHNLTFTNGSTNTSGTSTVAGINIAPTTTAAGSGGTMETYGIRIQDAAGTAGAGTQNIYGLRIGNQGAGTNTETTYGLYVDSQSGGGSASYAAIFAGGNVGIGDTTPNSLFTVGSGDLFQINSSGQVGLQQAPVSDYLFAANGTSANDNSRIIDIVQADDAAEDNSAITITNTAGQGSLTSGTRNIYNQNLSLTPTITATGSSASATAKLYGTRNALSLTNTGLGTTSAGPTNLFAYGNYIDISGNPTINDPSGANGIELEVYGSKINVSSTPTITADAGPGGIIYVGQDIISNVVVGTHSAIVDGARISSGGSGSSATNTGLYLDASGAFGSNTGLQVSAGGATLNYGISISGPTSGANNFAISSTATAKSYFAGSIGIGDSTPASLFTVGNGDLFQIDSSGRAFAPDGASGAGNLAYSFVSDTDTGVYHSAANEIRIQTGGSDRVTFDTNGRVGIGDTSPAAALTVGSGDLFQVNSSGAIAAATGLTSSGTITLSAFTTNGGLLYTNGSGVVAQSGAGTATTILHGGTTPSYSAVVLTTDVSGVLPVANGGTNCSSASITCFNNITGYTASGATGTTSTNLVFSGSPTIATPTFTGATITMTDAAKTLSFKSGTAAALAISDGTNNYETLDTRTGTSAVSAFLWTAGTAPSIASSSSSTYNLGTFTPGTYTFTGTTNTTATGTAAPASILFNQPTIAGNGTRSITETSNLVINGPTVASSSSGTETITTAYGLNILAGSALNGTGGAVTTGVGLSVNAPTGATNNYAALFNGGNVGIGTSTPGSKLTVAGNIDLNVNGSPTIGNASFGNNSITFANSGNISLSAPNALTTVASTQSSGSADQVSLSVSGTISKSSTTAYTAFLIAPTLSSLGSGSNYLFDAQGTSSSRVVITTAGNVGIGDTSPAALLTVGASDAFQVNSSGAIAAATGITSSGTIQFSAFTTNGGLLYTNGSGTVAQSGAGSATTILHGGTTPSYSAVVLTTDVSGVLPVANGGTNCSSASITCFNNITGYTASGATGTTSTNLVFSTSPTIATPTFTGATITMTDAAKTLSFKSGTAAALAISDGTNNYLTLDTRTGTSAVSAFTLTPGTAPSIASSSSSTYNLGTFTPGTYTFTGTTNTTATGTAAPASMLFNQPTIAGNGTRSITETSNAIINGPSIASSSSGTETITTAYGLNILAGSALNGTNGAVTKGVGLSVNAPTGATNNYAALFNGGNVGIGTTAPTSKLEVSVGNVDGTRVTSTNSGYMRLYSTAGGSSRNWGISSNYNGAGIFEIQNSTTSGGDPTTTILSIDSSGLFGFGGGATTHGNRIDVNGSVAIGASYYGTAAPSNGLIIQGNTSIGANSATSMFNVGSSNQFQVNSSGAIAAVVGITNTGAQSTTVASTTALTVANTGSNYALQVDTNTASSATGLKITSAAAGAGLALTTISSGTNENVTLDAKGSGTITIGTASGSTGDILFGGGSGSTGCTVTNSNGNFTCTGAGSFSNLSGTSSGTNTGDVTLGSFGSSPNANGASLSGQVLTLQPADGSNPGGVSTTTQTFAGNKTFSGTATVSSLLTASNGLTLTTGALNLTSTSGAAALTLSSSATAFNVNSGLFDIDTTNSRIGIGTTAPSQKLQVVDGVEYNNYSNMTPATMSGYDFGANVTGVYVSGKYAYVTQATNAGLCVGSVVTGCEFAIFDVSNKSSITGVSGVNLAIGGEKVFVEGKYAYVVNDTVAGTCSGTTLTGCEYRIYDISNPSTPAAVAGLDLGDDAKSIVVQGRYAYITTSADSGTCSSTTFTGCEFKIIDNVYPSSPTVVGGVAIDIAANTVFVNGRYAFIGNNAVAGTCTGTTLTGCEFRVYDVSNKLGNPSAVGGSDFTTNVNSIYVSGKYAYYAQSNNTGTCSGATITGCEVGVFDIADPSSPNPVNGLNYGVDATSVQSSGKYVYATLATVSGNDFRIIDSSDPTALANVGGVDLTVTGNSVFVSGKYAFVGMNSVSGNDLRIYDLGGADFPSITAGDAGFGSLSVTDTARIDNSLYVGNSINVGVGGLDLQGAISLNNTVLGSGAAAVGGYNSDITLSNSTSSGFQYGNRSINRVTGGTAGTEIGQFIRMIDNTSLDSGQVVRGLEVQAFSGTNTNGTNTGIASYGYTFGLQATTTAQAAAQAAPAAIFADLDNGTDSTTKARGNAIRAYTNDATSADLVYLYQETSAYTGNALLMDIGNGGGSFASGNFIKLNNAGTTKVQIASTGLITVTPSDADNTNAIAINTAETTAGQSIFDIKSSTTGNGQTGGTTKAHFNADGSLYVSLVGTQNTVALCHANNGKSNNDEIVDCSGAPSDVAEYFGSEDSSLEAGDVVVVGKAAEQIMLNGYHTSKAWVAKSSSQYQPTLMGVISTAPAVSYGDEIFKPNENPRPVALSGRVPVKVSNENGVIEPGDFLTASSTPGYAMKATKNGPVIGQALEAFSGGYGKIEVFVKATNYDGVAIEKEIAGLHFDFSNEQTTADTTGEVLDHLLTQLPQLDPAHLSQVHTDVVVAGAAVITPNVTTHALRTDALSAVANEGGIAVASTAIFNGGLQVDTIKSITDLISFQSDVEFFGTPYFTTDTAGFALVKAGVQTVDVKFTRQYLAQPIVNATYSFENDGSQSQADQVAAAQAFLNEGVSFVVTNKSKDGFTIVLNKPATEDIRFSWTALAVHNAKTFLSDAAPANQSASQPNNSPADQSGGSVAGDSTGGDAIPPTDPAPTDTTTDTTTPPSDSPITDSGSGSAPTP